MPWPMMSIIVDTRNINQLLGSADVSHRALLRHLRATEAQRTGYYDHLFAVSSAHDWDAYVSFFARGLEASARDTHARMLALVDVQEAMKETVRRSKLRADTAHLLIDFALAHVSFTVRDAERELPIAYGRVNALLSQLAALGLLVSVESGGVRRFYAPDVYDVLVRAVPPT